MSDGCAFCGRTDEAGKGLWHGCAHWLKPTSRVGICVYCARAAVRAFGEVPNSDTGVVALDMRRRPT